MSKVTWDHMGHCFTSHLNGMPKVSYLTSRMTLQVCQKNTMCKFLVENHFTWYALFNKCIYYSKQLCLHSLGRTSGKSSLFSPLCRAYQCVRLATHMSTLYFRRFSPLRDVIWRQPDQANMHVFVLVQFLEKSHTKQGCHMSWIMHSRLFQSWFF